MEKRPHILVMPFPAQGHVLPMMELSQCLVQHGFRISFVNTDYDHERVLNALLDNDYIGDHINLVSIPDGLKPGEDRDDFINLTESLLVVAPGKLEELIHRNNASEGDDKITCIVADTLLGWVFEVAETMKIPKAAFFPASAAFLSHLLHVNKLIDDGIIDNNGSPLKIQKIQLGPDMPTITTTSLLWLAVEDETTGRKLFDAVNRNNRTIKLADKIICNTAYDLEPGAFTLATEILPIGPLLASTRKGNSAGCFWKEDTLFQMAGETSIKFSHICCIWQPGITKETSSYPQGFEERVGTRGKIVEWAPQQKVLSHPSVGCFLSHCGWNSTMEGVANGVPFLCWPYYADQPINESYICDVWKVGLNFERDEFKIINREEIKNKVELLLSDTNIRERTEQLKEIAMKSVRDYGHSKMIFSNFVQWLSI
ncbi:UDP-Glycosyltransferase superfamily protein [Euphorbia peplus]|nr:UDP-Glycosyltransferase superfamily protein [Euphorbia peplus]